MKFSSGLKCISVICIYSPWVDQLTCKRQKYKGYFLRWTSSHKICHLTFCNSHKIKFYHSFIFQICTMNWINANTSILSIDWPTWITLACTCGGWWCWWGWWWYWWWCGCCKGCWHGCTSISTRIISTLWNKKIRWI